MRKPKTFKEVIVLVTAVAIIWSVLIFAAFLDIPNVFALLARA